jgi:type II secretory pathway pseudopilin PulG
MIIIGILAAIAIPVFLNQRAKARDTSTKADVSTVGKEVATYFVDGTGVLTASVTGSVLTLTDGAATNPYTATVQLSNGTALQAGAAGFTVANTATAWCVGLTNANGSQKDYKYSVSGGLQTGSCP